MQPLHRKSVATESLYAPAGKVLWDTCFIKGSAGDYHAFYLQCAPTKRPENRHSTRISIGHAVSRDLHAWQELPAAIVPGAPGAWDDLCIWNSCVYEKAGIYYQFYTARNSAAENYWIQRIGVVTSRDLTNWRKHPDNPLLEADAALYEVKNTKNSLGKIGAWRDPCVFEDSAGGGYYMTISARLKGQGEAYNGCLALAQSADLIHWNVKPPILAPGVFDEMEASQVVQHRGRFYIFFSVCWPTLFRKDWQKRHGSRPGLYCYTAEHLCDPFEPVNECGWIDVGDPSLYAVRLIEREGDIFTALGFVNYDERGNFIGRLSSPLRLCIAGREIFRV